MPQDLMNGTQNSNPSTNKSVSINLDALGAAANDTLQFNASNDEEKPILMKPVEAKIIGTDFRLMQNRLNSNKDDPNKQYFNTIFAVETEFSYDTEDEDGNKFTKTTVSRDNYSGLRYYPKFDDNGDVLRDATGTPLLDRFWLGDESAFGRLFSSVKEYDSTVRSLSDFFNFFNQPGLRCMIETEKVRVPGQSEKKIKQFIQGFV